MTLRAKTCMLWHCAHTDICVYLSMVAMKSACRIPFGTFARWLRRRSRKRLLPLPLRVRIDRGRAIANNHRSLREEQEEGVLRSEGLRGCAVRLEGPSGAKEAR